MINDMKNYTKFMYAREKFFVARSSLMLPRKEYQISLIASAIGNCESGLSSIKREDLDAGARESVQKLEKLIDRTGLDDPYNDGLYIIKAKKLNKSRLQKDEFCRLIDELASWFDEKSRE